MASPAAVKVYGPALSTAVSRVLACLNEKDIPFQLISLNMSKGEHRNPDFLKIHPFGQVPAFQDDHISLFESRAICRYVCEKHGDKGNKELYAFAPRMKIKQDQGAIRQSKEKLKKVLDVYDKRLGETRYLAGDEFTLADLSHLPNIHYLVASADDDDDDDTAALFTSSRENVSRWWTDISTRHSWTKVIDLHPKP
ncbi:glutathione transferase [Trifolium repens]|nr:glutathione transferase [Trifolium repens]